MKKGNYFVVLEWENGDDDIDRNAFDAFKDEPDDE